MPTMDGHTATRYMRDQGYKGTIIAVTASGLSQDREKCLESGMDYVLVKPFGKTELSDILEKVMAPPSLSLSRSNEEEKEV